MVVKKTMNNVCRISGGSCCEICVAFHAHKYVFHEESNSSFVLLDESFVSEIHQEQNF